MLTTDRMQRLWLLPLQVCLRPSSRATAWNLPGRFLLVRNKLHTPLHAPCTRLLRRSLRRDDAFDETAQSGLSSALSVAVLCRSLMHPDAATDDVSPFFPSRSSSHPSCGPSSHGSCCTPQPEWAREETRSGEIDRKERRLGAHEQSDTVGRQATSLKLKRTHEAHARFRNGARRQNKNGAQGSPKMEDCERGGCSELELAAAATVCLQQSHRI